MSQITKRAIAQSLKNLLLKKPLTKITINDIATDCGINRMTFYYHFKNIYDLVEWSCREDAKKALEKKSPYDSWQQGFLQIFEVILDDKAFISNVCRCLHRGQIEQYLKPLIDQMLITYISQKANCASVSAEDKAFIVQIYSYVFVGILMDWIQNDMQDNPNDIVNRVSVLLTGSISEALARFQS